MEHSAHSDWALRALEKILFKEAFFKSLVETTQAIDLIHGGVKSNALPEQAYAVVNHRISTLRYVANGSTFTEIQAGLQLCRGNTRS